MDNRRQFAKSAAAGVLILKPQTVFGSQANSTPQLGLIGCGSRGNWIANLFAEFTGARFTACADAFAAPAQAFAEKFQVAKPGVFHGMNSFQELLKSDIDAVVIETPTLFHAEQAEAAVNAGKHVYCAKPIAVDVPGAKRFLAASKKAAEKKLSFLVDFQTRARPVFQEAVRRVQSGDIGNPVFGHIYYHASRTIWHDTSGMSKEDAELKNWLHYRRISGDILVEQNIHVVDVANWYLNAHPIKAYGTGGQLARKDGDVWDHYVVTYWYPNGVKVDFSSCQFLKGYSDLCMRLYGSKGTMDAHYNGMVRMTGDTQWVGSERDDTFRGGAITNVKDFITSVREKAPLNNGEESVRSNLTCILGRMAAYREAVVTWDELMATTAHFNGSNRV